MWLLSLLDPPHWGLHSSAPSLPLAHLTHSQPYTSYIHTSPNIKWVKTNLVSRFKSTAALFYKSLWTVKMKYVRVSERCEDWLMPCFQPKSRMRSNLSTLIQSTSLMPIIYNAGVYLNFEMKLEMANIKALKYTIPFPFHIIINITYLNKSLKSK